jgi:hypothetical protein
VSECVCVCVCVVRFLAAATQPLPFNASDKLVRAISFVLGAQFMRQFEQLRQSSEWLGMTIGAEFEAIIIETPVPSPTITLDRPLSTVGVSPCAFEPLSDEWELSVELSFSFHWSYSNWLFR